jgi:hypothetical protein
LFGSCAEKGRVEVAGLPDMGEYNSHQHGAPASSVNSEPICCAACQKPKTAPVGSAQKAMLPNGTTSIGGTTTVAPSATARSTSAATDVLAK